MTTADGFFSQQTMMTNYVVQEEQEPSKVSLEISPEEEDRLRRQQQYIYPESEQSRPPSYRSRRASSSYNGDLDSDDDDELNTVREIRAQMGPPLLPGPQQNAVVNCQCENPQCIACVMNGNAHRAWKRSRRCGKFASKRRLCLHICISTFFMLMTIACLAGYWFTSRSSFSTSDLQVRIPLPHLRLD